MPVEVGLSDGAYTQIVRGLNDGDQVVVQMSSAETTNPFRGLGGGGVHAGRTRPGWQPRSSTSATR